MEVMMRPKTTPIFRISVLLAAVILIAGCTPGKGFLTGKKSDIDLNCPGDYCSENFRKVVRVTNVDGKCVEEVTECDSSEICVADSTGVECEPKIIDLPCSQNSKNVYLDPLDKNSYDPAIHICQDDCPAGFTCNAECICECPEPVFTDPYLTPIQPDLDFDSLYNSWKANRADLLDIKGTINISGYRHVRDGVEYYIPFPEVQLLLVPNPNNDYIEQFGGWCVNDYYEGDEALEIELLAWLERPEQACIWGGRASFEGILTVCPEHLVDWFDAYDK
jgi:hypothetical protein